MEIKIVVNVFVNVFLCVIVIEDLFNEIEKKNYEFVKSFFVK